MSQTPKGLLAFTRLRKTLFLGLLGAFFAPLLFVMCGGFRLIEDPSASLPILCISPVMISAWYVLVNIPGALFKGPWFVFDAFGASPAGITGWAIILGFWAAAAFVLSWPGNLIPDRNAQ